MDRITLVCLTYEYAFSRDNWEWSRVVPRQYFMPPTWLIGLPTDILTFPYVCGKYVAELDDFRAVLREQELETNENTSFQMNGLLCTRTRAFSLL